MNVHCHRKRHLAHQNACKIANAQPWAKFAAPICAIQNRAFDQKPAHRDQAVAVTRVHHVSVLKLIFINSVENSATPINRSSISILF